MRTNPGIPSRCNVTIEFPDYNAKELEQLFRLQLRKNNRKTVFTLDAEADEMLPRICEKMYLKRTDTFGNAREVRNLFDAALKNASKRGEKNNVLTYADIGIRHLMRDSREEDLWHIMYRSRKT